MTEQEKYQLIEETIKAVMGNNSIDRLIQDCADKLAITKTEVKELLEKYNSPLLNSSI